MLKIVRTQHKTSFTRRRESRKCLISSKANILDSRLRGSDERISTTC